MTVPYIALCGSESAQEVVAKMLAEFGAAGRPAILAIGIESDRSAAIIHQLGGEVWHVAGLVAPGEKCRKPTSELIDRTIDCTGTDENTRANVSRALDAAIAAAAAQDAS